MAVDGGSVKGRDLAGRGPLRLARGLAPLLALARLGLGPARLALGEIVALALGLAEDARLDDGAPEATQHRLEALARLLLHLHGPEDLLTPFAPPGGARLTDSPVAARGWRRATARPCSPRRRALAALPRHYRTSRGARPVAGGEGGEAAGRQFSGRGRGGCNRAWGCGSLQPRT